MLVEVPLELIKTGYLEKGHCSTFPERKTKDAQRETKREGESLQNINILIHSTFMILIKRLL